MTIGRQLYKGFGIVLAIVALLLFVDLGALWKARSASNEAAATLESVRMAENVRYQIMQNRLNLNNFLLSGDPRDEDKVNRGFTDLNDMVKRGQAQATNDILRTALLQVEGTEASWADNFAKPLLAKRHQVDSATRRFPICRFSICRKIQLRGLPNRLPYWIKRTATSARH